MLDAKRLVVLPAFGSEGTIAKTAGPPAYTSSAVSQQLAQLQREAGVQLFRHHGRRLELADAGRLLVERGSGLIAEIEALDAETRTAKRSSAWNGAHRRVPDCRPVPG